MKLPENKLPEVTLDNWPEVYDALEDRDPAPGFIELMSTYYEQKLEPKVIVDDEVQAEIAEVVESGQPMVFAMNHIHEDDTVLGAVALGKTAVRRVFDRIFVLVKDEHFRTEKKELVEKIGLSVFHPKRYADPKYRIPLIEATKRLQGIAVDRLAHKQQHMFIHGEGERSLDKDKTKVQAMKALLARIAFGVRHSGNEPIPIPIGVAYPNPDESAKGAVVVIGSPMTSLPEKQTEFNKQVRERIQELVNRGVEELQNLPKSS